MSIHILSNEWSYIFSTMQPMEELLHACNIMLSVYVHTQNDIFMIFVPENEECQQLHSDIPTKTADIK